MKPRDNEARFQFEAHDPDESLRKLWKQVQEAAPAAIQARLEEAKRAFPEIPFDVNTASNGAILRFVCEHFLKTYSAQPDPSP